MKKYGLTLFAAVTLLSSCVNENSQGNTENVISENAGTFKEIGSITIGSTGAAEISAYDDVTKKLFTVNNSTANKIDVIDLSNPSIPVLLASIDLVVYNGAANSVATYNGKLAVAMESTISKQGLGKVLIFDTTSKKYLYNLIGQEATMTQILFGSENELFVSSESKKINYFKIGKKQ